MMSKLLYKRRIYKELSKIPDDLEYKVCVFKERIIIFFDDFEIHVGPNHPFHPPRILTLNKQNYICNACLAVQKHFKNCCLCSQSLVASDNWTAGYTIFDVYSDIFKLKRNMLNIFNVYWLNRYLYRTYKNLSFSTGRGPNLIPYLISM